MPATHNAGLTAIMEGGRRLSRTWEEHRPLLPNPGKQSLFSSEPVPTERRPGPARGKLPVPCWQLRSPPGSFSATVLGQPAPLRGEGAQRALQRAFVRGVSYRGSSPRSDVPDWRSAVLISPMGWNASCREICYAMGYLYRPLSVPRTGFGSGGRAGGPRPSAGRRLRHERAPVSSGERHRRAGRGSSGEEVPA
jgi:hypothetical protein